MSLLIHSREKIRDYEAEKCIDDDDDEWCLGIDKVGMSGPEPVRSHLITKIT